MEKGALYIELNLFQMCFVLLLPSFLCSEEFCRPCTGDSGTQTKNRTEAKQWIEYDSNVAEVDGTLHVFSDAAVSDDEALGPPRVREKYVLLDSVPQVSAIVNVNITSSLHFLCLGLIKGVNRQ